LFFPFILKVPLFSPAGTLPAVKAGALRPISLFFPTGLFFPSDQRVVITSLAASLPQGGKEEVLSTKYQVQKSLPAYGYQK